MSRVVGDALSKRCHLSSDLKEVRRASPESLGHSVRVEETARAKSLQQEPAWCAEGRMQVKVGDRGGGKGVRREAGGAARAQ